MFRSAKAALTYARGVLSPFSLDSPPLYHTPSVAANHRIYINAGVVRAGEKGGRGFGRLETLKVFGPVGQPIIQSYGRRGADENLARGTGTLRSLHGGRMPTFARCCFRIAASLLVLTSPITSPLVLLCQSYCVDRSCLCCSPSFHTSRRGTCFNSPSFISTLHLL